MIGLLHARKWRGRATRAWVDRTNDGLSGTPADGISLPPKEGGLRHVPLGGSKVRLHQPRDWAEGGMTAYGTSRTWRRASLTSAFGGEPENLCSI